MQRKIEFTVEILSCAPAWCEYVISKQFAFHTRFDTNIRLLASVEFYPFLRVFLLCCGFFSLFIIMSHFRTSVEFQIIFFATASNGLPIEVRMKISLR